MREERERLMDRAEGCIPSRFLSLASSINIKLVLIHFVLVKAKHISFKIRLCWQYRFIILKEEKCKETFFFLKLLMQTIRKNTEGYTLVHSTSCRQKTCSSSVNNSYMYIFLLIFVEYYYLKKRLITFSGIRR